MRNQIVIFLAVLASACSSSKAPLEADLDDLVLVGAGGKADAFEDMIVGSLDYGQSSAAVAYLSPPRYRIFKFAADAGDVIHVRVQSTDGDALAWVVDDDLTTLAFNDDASDATLNSAIDLEVPAHPSRTHYIVFREYGEDPATFRVRLNGESAGCATDAECAMVEAGCCNVGDWTSVPTDEVEAFEAAKSCPESQVCPLVPIVYKGEQAICDYESRGCAIALPEELACGGHSINPHSCPDGWQCMGAGLAVDVPGRCVQTCGGFGNLACPEGLNCVDDPNDDCDPNGGGADCGGICVEGTAAGCDITGCDGDSSCQLCFGSWQCMAPNQQC